MLLEVIEDTVEFFATNGVSGERAWLMLSALSECKSNEFPDYQRLNPGLTTVLIISLFQGQC